LPYHHAKYAGYDYLVRKHNHHLPSGRGLSILQAESAHYPQDKDVAYHYPSSPIRAVGEASSI